MVFSPEKTVDLPTKDLLTWMIDDPTYDENKPVYIDASNPDRYLTRKSSRKVIRQIAAGLQAAGLQKGDCVLVHSFNDIYYSILVLGIIAAGGIFTGANPSYTHYELAHHVKTAKTKIMIAEPDLVEHDLGVAKECGIPQNRMFTFNIKDQKPVHGCKSWTSLLEHGETDWERFDDAETAKNTYAMRMFSSGTTGLPKATQLSHYNLIAEHMLVYEQVELDWEMRRVLFLPYFHVAVAPVAHTSVLRGPHPSYVMRRFEPEQFLQTVQDFKITTFPLVPPIVISLLASKSIGKYDLSSVKFVTCGAAPLDKDLQARLKKLLPNECIMTQVWGMTETTCIATQFYYPENDETGSVGRLIPNLEAKLVADDESEINSYDTRGELCVRGPTLVNGYFDNEKANASSFDKDGWFHTGDIAYCEKKTKNWYIVDRKKDLIKVRGFQVAPVELEAVLLSHNAVQDAAVVGITKEGAEVPRAYVKLREGYKASEDELKQFSGKRLAKYKSLDGGIVFLDEVPRNASGKILRKDLKERAKKEVESGKAKL